MDYRFERISRKNFSAFIEVFEAAFEKKVDLNAMEKKFGTNWTGLSYVGFLAFEKKSNEPAAYYGVYPVRGRLNGETILLAQSGDTATSPNHRRKGLFKSLHDLTMELSRSEGIGLVFGFPNPNSFPGFMKFGWKCTQEMEMQSLDLEMSLYHRINKKVGLKKFVKRQINSMNTRSIPTHNINLKIDRTDKETIFIERSNEYLDYKIQLGASVLSFDTGLAIVSLSNNILEVGSFYAQDENHFLNDLISFARNNGMEQIRVFSSDRSSASFFQHGFKKIDTVPVIVNLLDDRFENVKYCFDGLDLDTF